MEDLYCDLCLNPLDTDQKGSRVTVIPCNACAKDKYDQGFRDGEESKNE